MWWWVKMNTFCTLKKTQESLHINILLKFTYFFYLLGRILHMLYMYISHLQNLQQWAICMPTHEDHTNENYNEWIPLGVWCCFDSGAIVTRTVSSTSMTSGSKNIFKKKWRNTFVYFFIHLHTQFIPILLSVIY